MRRLPDGGRIDRSTQLHFTFDGSPFVGHPGDTLASALLANGVYRVATSIRDGRPRGVMSAGVDEASALVQIEAPFREPMLTATTVELYDGLVARGLQGRGALAEDADPARYDAVHAHCDVLVVGAGPAGVIAALTAARSGARVVLVDDQPEAGGASLGTAGELGAWVAGALAELRAAPDVLVLARTTAFGHYDDGFVLALEKRTDHLGAGAPAGAARQRVWRIRAAQVVVATGAHERPVAFTDNDRPGVMLAHAARTYLHRYGVLVGERIVVFTTNDSAYLAARDLAAAGADVTVVDARPAVAPETTAECSRAGVHVRTGQLVTAALGEERVTGASLIAVDGTPAGTLECDLLLVSGGWNPTAHLYSQARGSLAWDTELGALVPSTAVPGLHVAGSANGALTTAACLASGAAAIAAALAELELPFTAVDPPSVAPSAPGSPGSVLWAVPIDGTALGRPDTRYVDLQRDATVTDVLKATGAGLRSVEHVKRYTTIGTAHDQGKTSGLLAAGIIAQALGSDVADLGVTTFRPPYTSVSFAALAGRDRGALFDPVRVTSIHPWHERRGAVFENVGQWRRPQFYPQEGEDQDTAVARETRAARTGVAMMDASTLGKIDVQGSGAGEFLDRMYTNLMSTLKPGAVRYGAMCGLEGMIIDDGTVLRVDDNRFVTTTTTGNAAMVLEWMEEFLQTEWPDLDVRLTSVTEHWATIAVVGPQSRAVVAAIAPDLDVANEAFPFMAWRPTHIGGVPSRVCRISFSGELAYEVNVPAMYGLSLWQRLLDAGAEYGITPYGTDAMHVLRAEKGYPIIGQDTDGTVTPHDLGMGWVVSKKKLDFVGKRSFARPENLRTDRKQLVGLLPIDPAELLDEGAQVLAGDDVSHPPVAMLGHVTSSYRSVALERTFALALVRSGRDRVGERLFAWSADRLVPVTVTDAVLYDREGARRDG